MELRKNHKDRWLALIVLAIPLIIFQKVLNFYYVSFDDGIHLYRNELLNPFNFQNLKYLWTHLHNGLYVPMTYTLWGWATQLSLLSGKTIAANPFLFHGINWAMHAINGTVVYFILLSINKNALACLLGALFFALHPLQVESLAWISSFDGILAAGFGLGCILFWLIWLETKEKKDWFFSFLFLVGALLSKPGSVILPLLLLVFGLFKQGKEKLKEALIGLVPNFIISLVFAIIAKLAQPDQNIRFVTPWFQRPIIALDSLTFYVSKFTMPFLLSGNYGRTPDQVLKSPYIFLELVGFLVLVFWLYHRKEKKVWLLSVAVGIIPLLPVLGLIPFYFQKYSTVADRYMYLSLLGPSIGIAYWVENRRTRAVLVMIAVLIWCGLKSRHQLRYWETDTTNVLRTAQVNPTADHHFNLAEMLWAEMEGRNPVPGTPIRPLSIPMNLPEKESRIRQIKSHYEASLRLDPHYELSRIRKEMFTRQYP